MSAIYIDDDATTRFFVLKSLKMKGFNIHEAGNGKEGIEVIKSNSDIDTVLLDLNMPVMNGYNFLNEVSKDTSLTHLKIIVTSAVGKDIFVKEAQNNNISINQVVGYLEKPIHLPDLISYLSVN